MNHRYLGPLHEMAATTPTELWNDSCSLNELRYAVERGAVGATTNPVIVGEVLAKEAADWREPIGKLIADHPTASEDDLAWKLIEATAVRGAALLRPIFERSAGRQGRLSIQTDPRWWADAPRLIEQSLHFQTLAPNLHVKLPVTQAGLIAAEEVTFHGVSVNATVSFTAAQAIAIAEAIERGLDRRVRAGLPIADMPPVVTIMVGRVDDWLRVVAERDGLTVHPTFYDWSGVAVLKNAYREFRRRGFRSRLLAAAYRHHLHWSEFIGGDVVVSIPHKWQRRFNESAVTVESRIDRPVDPAVVAELRAVFPDFRMAYDLDGMVPAQFDTYGATRRTLRQFLAAYDGVVQAIRDRHLPNPDVR